MRVEREREREKKREQKGRTRIAIRDPNDRLAAKTEQTLLAKTRQQIDSKNRTKLANMLYVKLSAKTEQNLSTCNLTGNFNKSQQIPSNSYITVSYNFPFNNITVTCYITVTVITITWFAG